MHIGIDLRCLQTTERTGVGVYAFNFVNEILKQDSKNDYYLFFNFANKLPIPEFNYPNAHLAHFSYPNKVFNFFQLLLKYPKIDKLIADRYNLSKLDCFYSPHLNYTALSPELPHFITIHDLTFELFPQFLTLKQRLWHKLTRAKKICKHARKIFTPSENTKNDLIKLYGIEKDKIITIYPSSSVTNTEHVFQKDKTILFVGTIEPRKNLENLVIAFEKVVPQISNGYKLIIAGAKGWKNKRLFKQIKNSPNSEKIQVLNYQSEDEKIALYKKASIFVYPSFYEGFGFPVLEAMSYGVPVITSDFSSLPEVVGDYGLLVNPHKSEEIASAINELLNSDKLYKEFVTKGQKRAYNFKWEVAAQKWLETILGSSAN